MTDRVPVPVGSFQPSGRRGQIVKTRPPSGDTPPGLVTSSG